METHEVAGAKKKPRGSDASSCSSMNRVCPNVSVARERGPLEAKRLFCNIVSAGSSFR
jgi:hypothetical protein